MWSPVTNPESEDDFEEEELTNPIDLPTPFKDMEYGKKPPIAITKPITREESLKKREWDTLEVNKIWHHLYLLFNFI